MYFIRRSISTSDVQEYAVHLKSNGFKVFYGTREECEDWVERNGHDEWN